MAWFDLYSEHRVFSIFGMLQLEVNNILMLRHMRSDARKISSILQVSALILRSWEAFLASKLHWKLPGESMDLLLCCVPLTFGCAKVLIMIQMLSMRILLSILSDFPSGSFHCSETTFIFYYILHPLAVFKHMPIWLLFEKHVLV